MHDHISNGPISMCNFFSMSFVNLYQHLIVVMAGCSFFCAFLSCIVVMYQSAEIIGFLVVCNVFESFNGWLLHSCVCIFKLHCRDVPV
jgi:hypothetical protein